MKKIPRLSKVNDGERIYYKSGEDERKKFLQIKVELERKYAITFPSRDAIIKQLIATLTQGDYRSYEVEKIDLFVIRSDIKNFFPSVNKHHLYKKLMHANILSNSTMKILKPMFFSSSVTGIPLGLPFSSALAEIYLEEFDMKIYQEFDPIFYFRYVDDIIIIKYNPLSGTKKEAMKDSLNAIFETSLLEINSSKTFLDSYTPENSNDFFFDYLGYNFNIKSNILYISISDKKYDKISKKIKHFFYIFKKSAYSDKQFWLLYYRLMNSLYGITSFDQNKKKMRFGLGFNYRFATNKEQLNELITMVKGLIHSCKLSSKKRSILFYLIHTENSSTDILKKRFDYTRLTHSQLNEIKKRLQMTTTSMNINRIFYEIYKKIR